MALTPRDHSVASGGVPPILGSLLADLACLARDPIAPAKRMKVSKRMDCVCLSGKCEGQIEIDSIAFNHLLLSLLMVGWLTLCFDRSFLNE